MTSTGYDEGNNAPPPYANVGNEAVQVQQYQQAQPQMVDQNGNPIQVVVLPQGAVLPQNGMGGPTVVSTTVMQQQQVQPQQFQQTQTQTGGMYQPQTNYPGQQPQTQLPPGTTTTVVQAKTNYNYDDPGCLYVLACFGFFIPLIGFIGMCVYNCGSGLGPRQAQAFRVLVGCTIAGCIIGIIISVAG